MNREYTDAEKRLLDNIIRPVSFKSTVKGRFKLRAMKGDFIMRESAWSGNIIVNSAFDFWFQNVTSQGFMGFVAGAGTATALPTDTQLQSFLGGGGLVEEAYLVTNSTVSPLGFTVGVRCRANEGAIVGNVSEVAMCRGTSGVPNNSTPIINRARVEDEFGNPTSIAVLPDEYLEVIWEFTFYAIDGATGTLKVNLAGVPTDFDYEIRPISMRYSFNWQTSVSIVRPGSTDSYAQFNPSGIPSVSTGNYVKCYVTAQGTFGDPSSSNPPPGYAASNAFTGRMNSPYVPASKNRDFIIRLPLNNGNIASPGIRSINLSLNSTSNDTVWCTYQMLLDGPFEKKPTQIFDLPINVAMDNA